MNYINKKQNEIKGQYKKGFTLVEVIVVIVIIAILAAIAVPALTGYIAKAKERSAIAEAKTALTALQSISSQVYYYNVDGALYSQLSNVTSNIRNYDKVTGRATRYIDEINFLTGGNYKASNFVNTTTSLNYPGYQYVAADRIYFGASKGKGEVRSFLYISDDGVKVRYNYLTGFTPEK